MREIVLEAEDLWKRYGETLALRGLSFSVEAGRIHALLGPNGAGKTTTVKIIVGLVRGDRGVVRLFGEETNTRLNPRVRRRVGFAPEIPCLPGWARVGELLERYGMLYGMSAEEAREAGKKALDEVGLQGFWDRKIASLSKGQRQRVSIAQAIMHDPDLLVLDEPMLGLDPGGMMIVRSLIKSFARKGAGVLVNTHLLKEAEDLCDTVTLMDKGKSIFTGEMSSLKARVSGGTVVLVEIDGSAGEAARVLESMEFIESVEVESSSRMRVRVRGGKPEVARMSRELVRAGYGIIELKLAAPSLEEAFLKLIGWGEEK